MNNEELYVKMAIDGWQGQIKATNSLLAQLSDEDLAEDIAPGRNSGIYLLGHLAAVHDLMLPLLRFEEALYPELKPVFVDAPDKAVTVSWTAAQLRAYWTKINEKLQAHFTALSATDWFKRHDAVSEDDFVKEPHRNRLNLLMGRTNHLANHRGQMVLLVK